MPGRKKKRRGKTVAVYITDAQHQALIALADERDWTVSEVVRDLLTKHLPNLAAKL
jgi:hypothetical protein